MTIHNTPFLRNVLRIDGATGLIFAAVTILGANALSPLLGLPSGLLFWAGIVLLPFAGFLLAAASRAAMPRMWLSEIVAINALWVVASFGLLVSGLVQPTLLGHAFVIAQAAAVAALTAAQFAILRQSAAEPA